MGEAAGNNPQSTTRNLTANATETLVEASIKLAGRIREARSIEDLRSCPSYRAWQQAVEWVLIQLGRQVKGDTETQRHRDTESEP